MNIDIKKPNQMLSHVLLEDESLSTQVASTREWTDSGEIKATVTINGVEVSAESFENTLKNLFKQVEDHYAKTYDADNIDRLVEDRAKKLIQDHADNVLEKLSELQSTLESSDDFLKPYWERN